MRIPTPAFPIPAPQPERRDRPVRDFGQGYGRSSGYTSRRRYAASSVAPRFRIA